MCGMPIEGMTPQQENEVWRERTFTANNARDDMVRDLHATLMCADAIIEHFTGEVGLAYLDMTPQELLAAVKALPRRTT